MAIPGGVLYRSGNYRLRIHDVNAVERSAGFRVCRCARPRPDQPRTKSRFMNSDRFLHTIDGISTVAGKAAAWLIMGLMFLVCAEVFKRYILNMPTAWIFDASNMLYGTLFMIGGAYTLAQNAH